MAFRGKASDFCAGILRTLHFNALRLLFNALRALHFARLIACAKEKQTPAGFKIPR